VLLYNAGLIFQSSSSVIASVGTAREHWQPNTNSDDSGDDYVPTDDYELIPGGTICHTLLFYLITSPRQGREAEPEPGHVTSSMTSSFDPP